MLSRRGAIATPTSPNMQIEHSPSQNPQREIPSKSLRCPSNTMLLNGPMPLATYQNIDGAPQIEDVL